MSDAATTGKRLNWGLLKQWMRKARQDGVARSFA
jgi:hypothetical protein